MADRGAVRIGTSGWQYDHWRGRFYPGGMAKRRWLEHYQSVFPAVEINATFYRLPKESMVQSIFFCLEKIIVLIYLID